MGMSAEALQGQQGGTPAGTEPGQGGQQAPAAPQQPQQQSPYSLANEFSKNIPADVLPLIQPYISQWDGMVTKKFQELHSQYAPYKDLGDPDSIREAVAIAQALDENPQAIYEILREEMEGGQQQSPGAGAQPGQPGGGLTPQPPVGGFPPEVEERLSRTESIVAQAVQLLLQDRQQRDQASEDAEFEDYLDQLKQQYGDFEDDWVVAQIARGMDAEQAVQAWQSKVQEILNANGAGQQTPPVLSGGGVVPQEQLDVKSIPKDKLKSLVAGMLSQTNQAGG